MTGIAGIGKSRLAWEFYKYFDGIAETVYWHRGRCLSYGEGVTYWALADMVRMRCRIAEEEEPASALAKLRATLEEHILDAGGARFVEPRLAHLLGLGEHQARDRQDLFAAWRLFFERLAERYPTVLAFEDMQWADARCSTSSSTCSTGRAAQPIFVVTLARPELLERRPTWGAGQRNFTSLYLEPLSAEAMEELLTGLVPGLPAEVREQILARAEGVPLYAVETVRMLLDRGLLVQEGAAYRPTGEIEALEVPETLHALIAARLDGLAAEERRLLQDGAVLGKTFTRDALAALAGSERSSSRCSHRSCARRCSAPGRSALARARPVRLPAGPRSPRRLRDALEAGAARPAPRGGRAPERCVRRRRGRDRRGHRVALPRRLRGRIRTPRTRPRSRARRRRCSSAPGSAPRRSPRPQRRGATSSRPRSSRTSRPESAALLGRAGEMAGRAGDPDTARRLFEESIALYESQGDTHAAARVLGGSGGSTLFTGRRDEALARMERAFEVISPTSPTRISRCSPGLARGYWFSGDLERADRAGRARARHRRGARIP